MELVETVSDVRRLPWWLPPGARSSWVTASDPVALGHFLREVLGDAPPGWRTTQVTTDALSLLEALGTCSAGAREPALRALERDHSTPPFADAVAGLPPALWDLVLRAHGLSLPAGVRLWTDPVDRAASPHGVQRGNCQEWWDAGDGVSGAVYDERLVAWGRVVVVGDATRLEEVSPRQAWRARGGWWETHPALAEHLPGSRRGPGFLLACIVDGVGALLHQARRRPKPRELAAIWASLFLPAVAPAVWTPTPPEQPGFSHEPDYAVGLAFHALHPRLQRLVLATDRLSFLIEEGSAVAIRQVLDAAGRPCREAGDDAARHAARVLLTRQAEALLEDRAAAQLFDSGVGYKVLRDMMRHLDELPEQFYPEASEGAQYSPIARRLRAALGMALARSGTEQALASQLAELVWVRWCDPDFLT